MSITKKIGTLIAYRVKKVCRFINTVILTHQFQAKPDEAVLVAVFVLKEAYVKYGD
jgi:hypothetical protein